MTDNDYIKIPRSMFEEGLFKKEPFSKMQAWLDLIFLALPEDKDFTMRGQMIHGERGCAYISRGMLAKRWGWSDKKVVRFLEYLDTTQLTTQPTTQPNSWITSCVSIANYDGYIVSDPTNDPTNDPTRQKNSTQILDTTQLTTQPSNVVTNNKSTTCKVAKKATTQPTIQLGMVEQEKEENKETEKRKKISPIPPIKEINKEKEKKEEKEQGEFSDSAEILTLTCETSDEVKKPTKKEKTTPALIGLAKVEFENYYKERFGLAYYWNGKDGNAAKQFFLKLKRSVLDANPTSPVDDASMLKYFKAFIRRINNNWMLDNFTMCIINSKYNEIFKSIKNGTSTNAYKHATGYESGYASLERQKSDILAEARAIDERCKAGNYTGNQQQSYGTPPELPDF